MAPGVNTSAKMLCLAPPLLNLKVAEGLVHTRIATLAALSVLTLGPVAAKGSLAVVVDPLAAMETLPLLVGSVTAVVLMAVDVEAAVAVAKVHIPMAIHIRAAVTFPPKAAVEALSISAQGQRVPHPDMIPEPSDAVPLAFGRDEVVVSTAWWQPWWCWWRFHETPWMLLRDPVVPQRSCTDLHILEQLGLRNFLSSSQFEHRRCFPQHSQQRKMARQSDYL